MEDIDVDGTKILKLMTRKVEGKSLFGRPRRRWDYNIKSDHKEIVPD